MRQQVEQAVEDDVEDARYASSGNVSGYVCSRGGGESILDSDEDAGASSRTALVDTSDGQRGGAQTVQIKTGDGHSTQQVRALGEVQMRSAVFEMRWTAADRILLLSLYLSLSRFQGIKNKMRWR